MNLKQRLLNLISLFLWTFILHWEYPLVIAILIILHFTLGWSLWWIAVVLGAWLVFAFIRTAVIGFANRVGNEPASPKENKNPYSSDNSIFRKKGE